MIGINKSARTTTVKPAGTTSLTLGTSSGIHAWHNDYYIRRIRVGKNESMYKYLVEHHPELVEDEYFRPHDTACITVPQKAPEGAIMRTESPFQLLERVKRVASEWIKPGHRTGSNSHNVSATISLREHEWEAAGHWMWDNKKFYNGLSVLPYDGGSYTQAPFEDITEEQYHEMMDLRSNQKRLEIKSHDLGGRLLTFSKFQHEYLEKLPPQESPNLSAEQLWYLIRGVIKGIENPPDPPQTVSYEWVLNLGKELTRGLERVEVEEAIEHYVRYERWRLNRDLLDDIDLVGHAEEGEQDPLFDDLYLDEAQDLTLRELKLLDRLLRGRGSVKTPDYILAGDPLQTVNPTGFEWDVVKTHLYDRMVILESDEGKQYARNYAEELKAERMERTHRMTKEGTRFANDLIRTRNKLLKENVKDMQSLSDRKGMIEVLPFDRNSNDHVKAIQQILQYGLDGNVGVLAWARDHRELVQIIANDSMFGKDHIAKILDRLDIFSIDSIKGLEFDDVILYRFSNGLKNNYSDHDFNENFEKLAQINRDELPNLDAKDEYRLKYFINRLFVSLTRNKTNLIIIEDDANIESTWGLVDVFQQTYHTSDLAERLSELAEQDTPSLEKLKTLFSKDATDTDLNRALRIARRLDSLEANRFEKEINVEILDRKIRKESPGRRRTELSNERNNLLFDIGEWRDGIDSNIRDERWDSLIVFVDRCLKELDDSSRDDLERDYVLLMRYFDFYNDQSLENLNKILRVMESHNTGDDEKIKKKLRTDLVIHAKKEGNMEMVHKYHDTHQYDSIYDGFTNWSLFQPADLDKAYKKINKTRKDGLAKHVCNKRKDDLTVEDKTKWEQRYRETPEGKLQLSEGELLSALDRLTTERMELFQSWSPDLEQIVEKIVKAIDTIAEVREKPHILRQLKNILEQSKKVFHSSTDTAGDDKKQIQSLVKLADTISDTEWDNRTFHDGYIQDAPAKFLESTLVNTSLKNQLIVIISAIKTPSLSTPIIHELLDASDKVQLGRARGVKEIFDNRIIPYYTEDRRLHILQQSVFKELIKLSVEHDLEHRVENVETLYFIYMFDALEAWFPELDKFARKVNSERFKDLKALRIWWEKSDKGNVNDLDEINQQIDHARNLNQEKIVVKLESKKLSLSKDDILVSLSNVQTRSDWEDLLDKYGPEILKKEEVNQLSIDKFLISMTETLPASQSRRTILDSDPWLKVIQAGSILMVDEATLTDLPEDQPYLQNYGAHLESEVNHNYAYRGDTEFTLFSGGGRKPVNEMNWKQLRYFEYMIRSTYNSTMPSQKLLMQIMYPALKFKKSMPKPEWVKLIDETEIFEQETLLYEIFRMNVAAAANLVKRLAGGSQN